MVFPLIFMLVSQATDAEATRECEFGSEALVGEPCPATYPGSWIQTGDYPPASLRNDEEGIISFTLEIDENGAVSSCSLDDPSPFPTLNETTCRLLSQRARFIPPQNDAGENISSQYSSSIRWEIPDGSSDIQWVFAHDFDLTITANSDGGIIDCEVHRLETMATDEIHENLPSSDEYCEHMIRNGRMLISPDDETSFPQRFRIRTSVVPENQP